METVQEAAARVGFGLFEADLRTGELWKAGRRVKLQSQPFKVMVALLERPGEVISREELQKRLWGADAVGDFDHSLGTAINKIRDALGDTADNPRFVETLARRGYRWIAPVAVLGSRAGVPELSPGTPPADAAPALAPLSESPGRKQPSPVAPVAASLEPVSQLQPETAAPGIVPDSAQTAPAPPRGRAGPILFASRAVKANGGSPASVENPEPASPSIRRWPTMAAGALLGFVLAFAAFYLFRGPRALSPLLRIEQVTRSGRIAPGMAGMENLPAAVTDGLRLYVPVLAEGRSIFAAVDVHTGAVQQLDVPHAIESPSLGDISPDGSTVLLRSHLSPQSEMPFWTVPTSGGSALQLSNAVGHDATWMPDGKAVLYASGNKLLIDHLAEGTSNVFATLPGRAFWLRWSPDGSLLRFTLLDPVGHTTQLAEIGSDGHGFRTLLGGWNTPSAECCGVWTGDGGLFIFQSTRADGHGGATDLWRLHAKDIAGPVRVTDGPMNYVAPVAPRIGNRIYFLGLETESALQVYDASRKQFLPGPAFLSGASRVDYSRDRQWVTWTDMNGHQWRAHADGSETVQLTPESMQVFMGHWSPEGRRVALMARQPGKAWQIYLVGAEGGSPEPILPESRNQADPTWSPDGRRIVFGRVSDVMGKEEGPRALEIVDVDTRQVTVVPNSDGLFSPRWSPDGRFIAALSLDQRRLVLYDTDSRTWRTLAETTAADPVWSADAKSLYFHASLATGQPVYRVAVAGGGPELIAELSSFSGGTTADYFFCGLSLTNAPIVRTRTATGNLYSVDLDQH